MGAKGSKQQLVSSLRSDDFEFQLTSEVGHSSSPTSLHLFAPDKDAAHGHEHLLAVGCEDGSVEVYGRDGVHVRLNDPAASSCRPRVLSLHSLPRGRLLSVHSDRLQVWSLFSNQIVFSIEMSTVPRSRGGRACSTPYELTSSSMANEFDSRYCWLGTTQGEVLLFDAQAMRMSSYRVPLLQEVEAHCVATRSSGLTVPTTVTSLAQLPSDSSQLLLGFACGIVLTWHIGTQRLHRAYKRAATSGSGGGVTSVCWETGGLDPSRTAEHFVVGHSDGSIAVWRRKSSHAPVAVLTLSNTVGPRHPITSVLWSPRTFGFFVSGGHPISSSDPAAAPLDTGGVVFISGSKFDQRRVCANGLLVEDMPVLSQSKPAADAPTTSKPESESESRSESASSAAEPDAAAPKPAATAPVASPVSAPTATGVVQFEQMMMVREPSSSDASPSRGNGTPAFVCLHTASSNATAPSSIRVHLPTIQPPVPPLPLDHALESERGAIQLVSADAGDATEVAAIQEVIDCLREVHPSQRPWRALTRASLAEQHLWPLMGGMSAPEAAAEELRAEAEASSLLREVREDGTVAEMVTATTAKEEVVRPAPALLLTTTTGAESAVRLHDATWPDRPTLLAAVPLAQVLPSTNGPASVTTLFFCLRRRELVLGTSAGEVLVFRMKREEASTPPSVPKPTTIDQKAAASAASPTNDGATTNATTATPDVAAVEPTSTKAATETSGSGSDAAAAPQAEASSEAQQTSATGDEIASDAIPTENKTSSPVAASSSSPSSTSPASSESVPAPEATASKPVPASAEPAVAPTADAAAAPARWLFELAHRVVFSPSSGGVRSILYSSDADKYVLLDDRDLFAFLRPDTGVMLAQAIPNAHITMAHFSSEPLLKPKAGLPPSFLYVCASDGTVHVFSTALEAKVGVLPATVAEDGALEVIDAMFTVTAASTATAAGEGAATSATSKSAQPPPPEVAPRFLLCCTQRSLKYISLGPKGVETLLATQLEASPRLAFLLTSPHAIESRLAAEPNGGAAPPPSSVSRQPFLALLDARAMLTLYSTDLRPLLTTRLPSGPRRFSDSTFSISNDGRMAFLPNERSLAQARLFPRAAYRLSDASARLVRRGAQIESAAATSAPSAAPAASSSSWFSAFRPADLSHQSLFEVPMVLASQATTRPADSTSSEASRPNTSAIGSGATKGAASAANPTQLEAAQGSIATTKQTMAQSRQLAAQNLSRASEVADKSEEMSEHAGDFLAAARRLKQQQQSWW